MLNEVYNRRILELAGNIPRLGRLADAHASATAHSKLCGSTVTVDLKMDGDRVTDFAHDVKACALGQASSSIMARNVVGAQAQELRELRETVRRMLKEDGAPPAGKWSDVAVLEPVRDYKARHASTLLTLMRWSMPSTRSRPSAGTPWRPSSRCATDAFLKGWVRCVRVLD
jgi:NifU-like protein involved in Fe-S cluster formation